MQFHVLRVFFIFAKVFTLNNLGCKNDLYLVMIEAHIKDNLTYHCFQNGFKLYMILGNVNQTILFICEILQDNWFFAMEFHIGLYTLYGCQMEIICFLLFLVLHLCLKMSLSRVPMYMFFGNIFQITKLEI
jgi:hypothetical protein